MVKVSLSYNSMGNKIMPHKSNQVSGFTLMEVILAMAIIAIFVAGLASFDRLLSDSQTLLSLSSLSFNEANIGVDAMVRELRGADYADTGSYPLEQVDDQEITFYSNIDGDEEIERVRYFLDNGQMNRGVVNPVGEPPIYDGSSEQVNLVIDYIQNQSDPIFYYYNQDWPADTVNNPLPLASRLSNAKLIKVSLTVNPKPSRPESQFSVSSFAQIRNL